MIRSSLQLQAKVGMRLDLLARLDRLEVEAAAGSHPGFLGVAILVPLEDPDRVIVESSWASLEHLQRWQSAPEGYALLDRVSDLLVAEPDATAYALVDTIS